VLIFISTFTTIVIKPQAENATSKQVDLVRVAENTRKNLENEING